MNVNVQDQTNKTSKAHNLVRVQPQLNLIFMDEDSGSYIQQNNIPLGYIRQDKSLAEKFQTPIPSYGSEEAGCFDLRASIARLTPENVKSRGSVELEMTTFLNSDDEEVAGAKKVIVHPKATILVPCGFIFDIIPGLTLDLMPRSGASYNKDLVLKNMIGIIDADFPKETLIMITNVGTNPVSFEHNERICQARLMPVYRAAFIEQSEWTDKNSSRTDGIGHTGSK